MKAENKSAFFGGTRASYRCIPWRQGEVLTVNGIIL